MANYNVDIAVAIKNARALKTLNKDIKATSKIIDDTNAKLRQSANAYEANFNRLNSSVREARKNLNEAAIGTNAFRKAGEELLRAQNQLNTALKEEARILKEIETRRFGVAQSSSSNRVRRNVAESSKNRIDPKFKSLSLSGQSVPVEGKIERTLALRRDEIKLQEALLALELKSAATENAKLQIRGELNRQTATAVNNARFIGQSSPLTSAVSRGYSSPIGPMPMPPMQGPILPSAAASMRREQARAFPKERGDFGFGLAGDPVAKSIRRNQQKREKLLQKELKIRQKILQVEKLSLGIASAEQSTKAFGVPGGQIGPAQAPLFNRLGFGKRANSQGLFANSKGVAGRISGSISSGLIGGGFPLLFGQGPLAAAGGGIGGLAGGALGGGFGFGLSIAGTAIASRIQETLDFRKAVDDLNVSIRATGGTSLFSSKQVAEFAKSLGMTKEEALETLKSFKQFEAAARITLTQTFGSEGTFDIFAGLKDNQSVLNALPKLSKELSLDQAKIALDVLKTNGARSAELKLLEQIFSKNKQIIIQENEKSNLLDALNPFRGGVKRRSDGSLRALTVDELETERGEEAGRNFQSKLDQAKALLQVQRDFNKELERQAIIKAPVDELERLLDPLTQIDALGKSIGDSFSESFKGIVRGSMTAQQALANLFSRTADHFLDMAAQILAAQIRSGIFGIFSNFLSPSLPSTQQLVNQQIATHGNTVPAGSFGIGSKATDVFPKAMGGPVSAGGAFLVGEEGPELLQMGSKSGNIIPNHDLGGTTNVVVNVDASGSAVQGDDDSAAKLGEVIAAAVQAEIVNQKMSGGLLS